MPQLCCTWCEIVTGRGPIKCKGVHWFCWNLTYKCFTVLPPHKKNFKSGRGWLHLIHPLEQFETQGWLLDGARCMLCVTLRTTGDREAVNWFCSNLAYKWPTILPPRKKKFQGWAWAASLNTPTRAVWNSRSTFAHFVLCAAAHISQLRNKRSCVLILFKLGIQVANYAPPSEKSFKVGCGRLPWKHPLEQFETQARVLRALCCVLLHTFHSFETREVVYCFCSNLAYKWPTMPPLLQKNISGWAWAASMKTPTFAVWNSSLSFCALCVKCEFLYSTGITSEFGHCFEMCYCHIGTFCVASFVSFGWFRL